MSEKSNTKFTSGQFAKLHNINRRTLHYYDQIGLFSPAIIGDNNYRYYSLSQCLDFSMIRSLRELDVSIEEIMTQRLDPDAMLRLFHKKIADIEEKIEHLSAVKQTLEEKSEILNTVQTIDTEQIYVTHHSERHLKTSKPILGTTEEQELQELLEFSNLFTQNSLFNHVYGTAISVDKLTTDVPGKYDFYYAQLQESDHLEADLIIPEGDFLVGYCVGDWEKLGKTYEKMLRYAKENGLTLYGYAYEQGMNEVVIQRMEEYITRISIPCKSIP